MQAKLYHPFYGSEMIRNAGGCEKVAWLVERHHDPGGDQNAEWLRKVDSET
jgi:hypothetical protein